MMQVYKILVCLSVLQVTTDSACVRHKKEQLATKYLASYGYIKSSSLDSLAKKALPKKDLRKSLLLFQNFHGLKKTGVLDDATIKIMRKPRCGNADISRKPLSGRRYSLMNRQWPTTNLTYEIKNDPKSMSHKDTAEVIKRAFAKWSDVTPLTFKRVTTGVANIHLSFEEAHHNCQLVFKLITTNYGTQELAHTAAYPHAFLHFFNALNWTVGIGKRNQYDLFQVAVHEIGHVLGLDHSQVEDSIMYPMYHEDMENVSLKTDDIEGIQQMYGAKESA